VYDVWILLNICTVLHKVSDEYIMNHHSLMAVHIVLLVQRHKNTLKENIYLISISV